jgi:hypothetical protein
LKGWRHLAACKGAPDSEFFARSSTYAEQRAVELCRGCPVTDPCLAEGVSEEFGVWGGLTVQQREYYGPELEAYVRSVVDPRCSGGWWLGNDTRGAVAGSSGDDALE